MTDPEQQGIPPHGDMETFGGDPERREHIQREIDAGREAELSEEDYQVAIEHGLIEG